jgi:hypothetical protein
MADYRSPISCQLAYDFENAPIIPPGQCLSLSHKEVLAIVQSALDELGPPDAARLTLKRRVFEEVAEGRLAQALRTAILGANSARRVHDT